MRVIAGSAKGRSLVGPKSNEIRPALDQVKEAIFNILFDVEGKTVLDLFAGTGSLGIEALSRGAAFATFVDNSKEGEKLIQTNLEKCGFFENTEILTMSVGKAIKMVGEREKKFDLIFIDPPYQRNLIQKTLKKILKEDVAHSKTVIITEHHPKEPIGEIEGLNLTSQRKYGQTLVSFLARTTK